MATHIIISTIHRFCFIRHLIEKNHESFHKIASIFLSTSNGLKVSLIYIFGHLFAYSDTYLHIRRTTDTYLHIRTFISYVRMVFRTNLQAESKFSYPNPSPLTLLNSNLTKQQNKTRPTHRAFCSQHRKRRPEQTIPQMQKSQDP